MSKLFFTSDLHFGHENIIKYCNRPFKSIEEMNEKLIRNWNERVKYNDMIYILGDFYFKGSTKGNGLKHKFDYYNNQLNGNKVFIKGNHEESNSLPSKITSFVIEFAKKEIYCCHNPYEANYFYPLCFTGHVHNDWKYKVFSEEGFPDSICINVGVDVWGYKPIKAEELLDYYLELKEVGEEKQ